MLIAVLKGEPYTFCPNSAFSGITGWLEVSDEDSTHTIEISKQHENKSFLFCFVFPRELFTRIALAMSAICPEKILNI